jgi:hypothetical protein
MFLEMSEAELTPLTSRAGPEDWLHTMVALEKTEFKGFAGNLLEVYNESSLDIHTETSAGVNLHARIQNDACGWDSVLELYYLALSSGGSERHKIAVALLDRVKVAIDNTKITPLLVEAVRYTCVQRELLYEYTKDRLAHGARVGTR